MNWTAGPEIADVHNVERQVRMVGLVGTTAALAIATVACAHPEVKRSSDRPPSQAELAQLWIDPGDAPRDMSLGAASGHLRPQTDARYEVVERDAGGFSITYEVRDARGAEWNVKIGPEAQAEVVSSRILWALGYHQLPSFFVERWIAVADGRGQVLGGARFRPREDGLDGKGLWSWQQNPFVGTREYNGLLALLMLINSTDLKNDNNEIYDVERPREGAPHRVYIVKDLGASLGETGRVDPRRNFLDGFEREPFLKGRDGEWVRFAFRGRHQELLRRIPVAHLQWICRRVLDVPDDEWRKAFASANYDPEITARYVARIREKAHEGLDLQ
jgi:hypothetical protein